MESHQRPFPARRFTSPESKIDVFRCCVKAGWLAADSLTPGLAFVDDLRTLFTFVIELCALE